MERPIGTTIGVKSGALLVSIGIHAAIVGTLIVVSGRSEPSSPGLPSRASDLTWVHLAASVGPSGPPAGSALAAVVPPDTSAAAAGTRALVPPRARPTTAEESSLDRTPDRPRTIRSASPAPEASALAESKRVREPSEASPGPRVATRREAGTGPTREERSTEGMRLASLAASDHPGRGNAAAMPTGSSIPSPWPGAGLVDHPARPRWPIRPRYPASARRQGDESLVVVEAWVDDGGDVAFSSILESGGDDFDDSALHAVRHASFSPARLDGRAVASRVALRIHFALRD